jgi:hypothetical protein
MNTKSLLTKAALTAGAVGILAGAGATAASAATTPAYHGHSSTVTAVTRLINRNDGGGGPNPWAYDTMTRTLAVTSLGKVTITPAMVTANSALAPYLGQVMYQYDATLHDVGTFKDIPGQLTPNQGGRYLGDVLKPTQVSGPMSGYGDFGLFYSTAKVNSPRTFANEGVPIRLKNGQNTAYPSYTWPELAFPAGTSFVGVNEFDFGYVYQVPATVRTVVIHGVKHVIRTRAQNWADTAANGDGQLQHDGNITGR